MLVFYTAATDSDFFNLVQEPLQKIRPGIEHRKVSIAVDKEGVLIPGQRRYKAREGETVLCMGEEAMQIMKDHNVIAKKFKTINSLRGLVFRKKYMFSFSPKAAQEDPAKIPLMNFDVVLADRYNRTGSLKPILGKYKWVDDLTEVIQQIEEVYKKTGKRALTANDLETMGLDPFAKGKKIVSTCFTVLEGTSIAVYLLDKTKEELEFIYRQVKWILNSKKVRLTGANFKYDLLWYRVKKGILCTNFLDDTLLMGSLINENRSNSLKNHAMEYTPDLGGYEEALEAKYDKGHMELIPKDDPDFLGYVGGDTQSCHEVNKIMRKELIKDPALYTFYRKIAHPASRTFESIEYQGLVVDKERFAEVREEVKAEVNRCRDVIYTMLPQRLQKMFVENEEQEKNGLTPAILSRFLFEKDGLNLKPKKGMVTAKTKKPSITKDHLMMFIDDKNEEVRTFIEAYASLNSSNKIISTYIDGFLSHLRSDGKFHPTYALFSGDLFGNDNAEDEAGTVTGRLSARAPSIQTLVKRGRWAKLLRSCYPTVPGYVLFQIDENEGELRVAADIANEPTMIEVYRQNKSLHAKTGAELSGLTIEEMMALKTSDRAKYDTIRSKAKAINFGFLFSLRAEGFKEYARTAFGLTLTLKEAEEYRSLFFKTYNRLEPWHTGSVKYAEKNGCVVSPLGRVRHLPLINSRNWFLKSRAERQSINSCVQATLSDVCLYGASKIRERFTEKEVWIAGMTHDSLYGYIPETHYLERLREMKHIMENLPLKKEFDWEPRVPFVIDAEISTTTLADLKSITL